MVQGCLLEEKLSEQEGGAVPLTNSIFIRKGQKPRCALPLFASPLLHHSQAALSQHMEHLPSTQ